MEGKVFLGRLSSKSSFQQIFLPIYLNKKIENILVLGNFLKNLFHLYFFQVIKAIKHFYFIKTTRKSNLYISKIYVCKKELYKTNYDQMVHFIKGSQKKVKQIYWLQTSLFNLFLLIIFVPLELLLRKYSTLKVMLLSKKIINQKFILKFLPTFLLL